MSPIPQRTTALYPVPNICPGQIFEQASSYFINNIDCCAQSTYSSDPVYNYTGASASSDVPIAVIQLTPIQYQRCTIQKPPEQVPACVTDTIAKLRWIDSGMFIWGGQPSCDGVVSLFVGMAFTMLIELLHMGVDLWWYRFRGETPRFSWVKLWWSLVAAFGEPILKAYLLYRHSFGSSMWTLLRIFLLTPRIAPVIGVLSPLVAGSKSWGVQVLTVDTLLAILGLFSPFMFVSATTAGVSVGFVGVGGDDEYAAPEGLALVGIGSLLAVVPAVIVAALYMASGVVMWGLFILACLIRKSRVAGWGLNILGFWLCLVFFFVISPLFAIWEVCWRGFCRERKDEFPPLRWAESFVSNGAWWSRFLRSVGYWIWCAVQFVVFVGRWMVLANILPVAGDAFCPVGVKAAAAESALLALGTVLSSLGLRYAGLTY